MHGSGDKEIGIKYAISLSRFPVGTLMIGRYHRLPPYNCSSPVSIAFRLKDLLVTVGAC